MPLRKLLDGNHAAAWAIKLAKPGVVPIYPITPQTEVVSTLADFIEKGELNAEYVPVESEHSAMGVAASASATGSRTFTASNSQGIVHMEEPIWWVSGWRLPVVMGIVNRAIGFPGSLSPDHNDSLLQRDTGWLQLYCENAQEVLDTLLQAYRIGEDQNVMLPVIVAWEGFVVGHAAMPVMIPDQADVDKFLPPYKNPYVNLLPEKYHFTIKTPAETGGRGEYGTEYRYQMHLAHEYALKLIPKINDEYGEMTGRKYGNGLIEEYKCEDAEAVIMTMGSMAGTARYVIDKLREKGNPIGLIKMKTFRPFPTEEIRKIGSKVKVIGYIDRAISQGSAGGGPAGIEVCRALYPLKERPLFTSFYCGLSGREVSIEDIEKIANITLKTLQNKRVENEVNWPQLRGGAD
jgi:pyruvate ferredoxin oxidoreductase alpha subunit